MNNWVWCFLVLLLVRGCLQSSDIDRLERRVNDLEVQVRRNP